MQHLSEDVATHRSDLKHTLTAKLRVEEQEKKAQDELRAAAYELWMVEDELQIAREELKTAMGELRLKTMTLSQVFREVSEVESTMGRLNDECHELRDDLQRQLVTPQKYSRIFIIILLYIPSMN